MKSVYTDRLIVYCKCIWDLFFTAINSFLKLNFFLKFQASGLLGNSIYFSCLLFRSGCFYFFFYYYLDLSFSTPFNSTSTLFWKLLKWRKKVWLLCLLQLHLMLSILNFQIPHRGKVMNKRHLFDYGFITVVTCMIVQNAGQIASKHFQSGASVALPRSHLEAWDQKVHLQSQKKK